MKTIVRIKYGSHLYGTSTPESDTDYRAVHIPDPTDILLQRVAGSVSTPSREKGEGEKNTAADIDDKSYSLQRFFQLCAEGQTEAIDMLFAPADAILETSSLWRYLVENRHRLISKQSAAFLGYCRQQANKYGIKGSRVAASEAAAKLFESEIERGHGEERLAQLNVSLPNLMMAHPDHIQIIEQAVGSSGEMGTFFDCCGRKAAFNSKIKEAAKIYRKVADGYGARAKQAQVNEGVDWKALSHAVRVGTEALELLTTGHVTMPRPDAEHLLDIKKGNLPYKGVSEEIEYLLELIEKAAEESTLPNKPDKRFMEEATFNAYCSTVVLTYEDRFGGFGKASA